MSMHYQIKSLPESKLDLIWYHLSPSVNMSYTLNFSDQSILHNVNVRVVYLGIETFLYVQMYTIVNSQQNECNSVIKWCFVLLVVLIKKNI